MIKLPFRIWPGHTLDVRKLMSLFDFFGGRFPLKGCDIDEVFAESINWDDFTLPNDVIDVDELFRRSRGALRALACMDYRTGMEVIYDTATSIKIKPGQVLHRGDFKEVKCDTDSCASIVLNTTDLVLAGEDCSPTEGNPSGLDADEWNFVYADTNVAANELTSANVDGDRGIVISPKAPVVCDAKGPEHPDFKHLRFIGSIYAMSGGTIRPFDRYDNGWTIWRTAAAKSDYQTDAYYKGGTPLPSSASWVRYTKDATGVDYHDGPRHIPPTADAVRIAIMDDSADTEVQVRPVGWEGEGFNHDGSGANNASTVEIPVNSCGLDGPDLQTFEWKDADGGEELDVCAYREHY